MVVFSFQLFINNEFVDAVSGKKFATLNPTNETVIAEVAEGDKVISSKQPARYANIFIFVFFELPYAQVCDYVRRDKECDER